MTRTVVHIGLHKTGSTWIQKYLVPLYGSKVFSYAGPRRDCRLAFAGYDMKGSAGAAARERILGAASAAVKAGTPFFLSHERLSGYLPRGAWDRMQVARSIKKHLPDAHVIVTIREQTQMIYALWKQQIVDGGGLGLRKFLDEHDAAAGRMPRFRLQCLLYDELLLEYQEIFGPERVSVLCYEMMRDDLVEYVRRVSSVLDAEAPNLSGSGRVYNASLSPLAIGLIRVLNNALVRTPLTDSGLNILPADITRAGARMVDKALLSRMPTISNRIEQKHREYIRGYVGQFYANSNAILQKHLGERLEGYGYVMAKGAS